MKHTMRWFGPNDPVSLMDIRQAGCTGVVTALHQIPVGEVWPEPAIRERRALVEAANNSHTALTWEVVESLPVHEAIKKGLPSRERYIAGYIGSLRNLAACGIHTVCYNFMPVLDWSRTELAFKRADGSETLRFVWQDFALFDLFVLRRPEAEADYDEDTKEAAFKKYKTLSGPELERLADTVLLGLPGSGERFDLSTFQSLLDAYGEIGANDLRAHLQYFLQQITPEADALGIRLCIHPDDPPRPLLGLPRVVSTEADLELLFRAVPSVSNGLTFCTGSLGVRADNDLPGIVGRWGSRIHFAHLRSVQREADPRNFHEAPHLEGNADMYSIVAALVAEEKAREEAGRTDCGIPMRPDHGFRMLDDFEKDTYPGYSAIGRLKGLAELRGLEYAIRMKRNRINT